MLNRSAAAAILALVSGAIGADQRASEVFSRAEPSVVTITQHDGGNVVAIGSGIVVGDGKVSTNYHVVAIGAETRVHYRGERYTADIDRYAEPQDLALLNVRGLHAPAVRLGRSDGLEVGQTVYAIGSPRGLELTLSEGIVSGLRGNGVIQMTTPISPGSSGGGLFDEQGRLIGIPTLQVREAQNLNFAAPVEWLTVLGIEMPPVESRRVPAQPVPPPKTAAVVTAERAMPAAPIVAPPPAAAVPERPVIEAAPEAPVQQPSAAPAAPEPAKSSYVPWLGLLALVMLAWWFLRPREQDAGNDPVTTPSENKLAPFEKAARQELTANQTDADLWLQALQRSGGGETAAKVLYIRLRADQLYRRDRDQRWAQAVAQQSGGPKAGATEPPQAPQS